MMGLIQAGKKRLDVPDEKGQWIEVLPLTGPQLDEARTAKMAKLMELAGKVDVERLAARRVPGDAKPAKPLDELDAATIVDAAVSAWSYGELQGKPSEQLDAPTFDWLAGQIAEMNVRPPSTAPASEPT